MDVDRSSFQPRLLALLEAIANAHFVAFDFELSGIQSKQSHTVRATDAPHEGKQSLQQRYAELKDAAEKYQILQVGITCVEEDTERGVYVTRPYNFYLNPVFEEKGLDVERIFSYQSGAVEFLLGHRFRMEAPYLEGVPYLSRDEEAQARKKAAAKQDGTAFTDIQLKAEDLKSVEFVARVRQKIDVWRDREEEEPSFLNIAPVGHEMLSTTTRGLNNFEKRLVHQLVRAEYPMLVTIGRPTFIQIVAYNEEREAGLRKSKVKRLEEQLSRQIGLRWLVEAMVGGDLSGINTINFARSVTGEPIFVNLEAIRHRLAQVQEQLKGHRTVIVGHNLFTDLVYFYKCFLGKLPDRVEDFQRIIHGLFPLVVDTKYLATHNCGSISLKSSLDEIEEELRQLSVPVIETHSEHPKYSNLHSPHEAGYDSFLTAKVLIRLSAQLEAAGTYLNEMIVPDVSDDEAYHTAPEDDEGGVSLNITKTSAKGKGKQKMREPKAALGSEDDGPSSHGVSIGDTTDTKPTTKRKGKSRAKKHKRAAAKKATATEQSAFSHRTKYDVLMKMPPSEDEEQVTEAPLDATTLTSIEYSEGQGSNLEAQAHGQTQPLLKQEPKRVGMMPAFDRIFWRVYGNKLRVFGTVETVCDLTAA